MLSQPLLGYDITKSLDKVDTGVGRRNPMTISGIRGTVNALAPGRPQRPTVHKDNVSGGSFRRAR